MGPIVEKAGDLWESQAAYWKGVTRGEIEPDPEDLEEAWYKRAFPEKQ